MIDDLLKKLKDRRKEEVGDFEAKVKEVKEIIEERRRKRNERLSELENKVNYLREDLEELTNEEADFESKVRDSDFESSEIEAEGDKRIDKSDENKTEGLFQGYEEEERRTIPPRLKDWIEENLDRGYGPEQLKKSLRRGDEDPSYVDLYMDKYYGDS